MTLLVLLPLVHAADTLPWVPCASLGQAWDGTTCVGDSDAFRSLANDLASGHNLVLAANEAASPGGDEALTDGRRFYAVGLEALGAEDGSVALAEELSEGWFDDGFSATELVSSLMSDLVEAGEVSRRLADTVIALVEEEDDGTLTDAGLVARLDGEIAVEEWDASDADFLTVFQAVSHASHDYWASASMEGGPGTQEHAAALDAAVTAAATKACEKRNSNMNTCAAIGKATGARASKAYVLAMEEGEKAAPSPKRQARPEIRETIARGDEELTLTVSGDLATLTDARGEVVDERTVDLSTDGGDPSERRDDALVVPLWTADGWLVLAVGTEPDAGFVR